MLLRTLVPYHRTMAIRRMDHVGIVVDDLEAATAFFLGLGLEPGGGGSVEGRLLDRIVGLEGARTDFAFVQTPDGHGRLELIKFHAPSHAAESDPAPSHAPGIRHVALVVEDIHAVVDGLRAAGVELVGELVNYQDSYWLCYVRGPEGIIVELAEKIG